jgi:hypothetical protein
MHCLHNLLTNIDVKGPLVGAEVLHEIIRFWVLKDLMIQFVPRSKRVPSRLQKQVS